MYKFDEHHYSSPREPDGVSYWREPPEDLLSYLEAFAQELQKNPSANGYLIAYRSTRRDRPVVSQTMLRKEGNFLIGEFGIKASRIKTIDGGYREWRTMELWIAQKRESFPIITSYRYSPPRRGR